LTNVTGRLVAADPIWACKWEDINNKEAFEGNIVLARRDHCSPVDKFDVAQKGSAHAIVILVELDEYIHLSGSYFLHAGGITIPGFEYRPETQDEFEQIVKWASDNNTEVQVLIQGEQIPIPQKFWLSFSIIQGTFSLINFVLAYRKIKQLFKAKDINKNLPQVILTIEMLTNMLRVILCLEPDYGIGRGLIEFGTLGFLQSGTLPWSMVPTLIIAFYWDNAIINWEKYLKKSWSVLPVKRCRVPLIVSSSVIVMADLISGVIRAMYFGNKRLAWYLLMCAALIVLFIAILFTLNGARALIFMYTKCQEANLNHKRAMKKMMNFVAATSFGMYVVVGSLLFMTLSTLHSSWEIGYFAVIFTLNVVSFMQIMSFNPQTIFELAEIEKVSNEQHIELAVTITN